MGSVVSRVTKSGERRWVGRLRDPMGRSRERWFRTKGEATRFVTAEESKIDSGRWIDPSLGRVTLMTWADEWRGSLVGLKPKTRDSYESLLSSRIIPSLGHLRLSLVRPSTVKAWMAEMEAQGLSGSRISQAVNLLSRIMRDAVHDEVIERNPCDGIRRPAPKRAQIQPLSVAELSELVNVVDPRYSALVATLAYTGMRFGEACALRWNRVNLLRRVLTVSESLSITSHGIVFGPTKTHSVRQVSILDVLVPRLEDHLASATMVGADDLVFTTPGGGVVRGPNFTRRVWKPAVREVGRADLRIHDLRHTCASLLIHAGASLVDIAAHLGHENPTTTLKYYGHLIPGSSEAIAQRLNTMIGGSREHSVADA